VPYSWSDNGNLLSDGATTYNYDHANRLATAVQGATNYGFSYNGLGDRLRQTINSAPVTYALDLEAGFTQVLSDGANAYLYGNARIGEEQPAGWQYHLGDALGSVRQLVDNGVSVALSRAYEPFGDPLLTTGTGSSIYGFTGEQRDGTGLTNLTNHPGHDAQPVWSPDGRQIAFASTRDGNWDIYVMDAKGTRRET
jgi:YD repeat-containing protein